MKKIDKRVQPKRGVKVDPAKPRRGRGRAPTGTARAINSAPTKAPKTPRKEADYVSETSYRPIRR